MRLYRKLTHSLLLFMVLLAPQAMGQCAMEDMDRFTRSLIHVKNEAEVQQMRDALVRMIWKGEGFPSGKLPQSVREDVPNPFPDLPHVNRREVRGSRLFKLWN